METNIEALGITISYAENVPGTSTQGYDIIARSKSGEGRKVAWVLPSSQTPPERAKQLLAYLVEGFSGATLSDQECETMALSPVDISYFEDCQNAYHLIVSQKGRSEKIAGIVLYPDKLQLPQDDYQTMVRSVFGYVCGKMQLQRVPATTSILATAQKLLAPAALNPNGKNVRPSGVVRKLLSYII